MSERYPVGGASGNGRTKGYKLYGSQFNERGCHNCFIPVSLKQLYIWKSIVYQLIGYKFIA